MIELALTLTRLPDWPERLALTIERARGVHFAWGSADCVSFAAACVHAVTGADVLGPGRGGWSTATTAARQLARRGGLAQAVRTVLGPECHSPLQAQRGDILLVQGQRASFLGVCDGPRWWAPSAGGLVAGVASLAVAYWPIGWQPAQVVAHG